jgi:hypothetical protein
MPNIEANSIEEAVKIAHETMDPHAIFNDEKNNVEWAEENVGYLVDPLDENGEIKYDETKQFYGSHDLNNLWTRIGQL